MIVDTENTSQAPRYRKSQDDEADENYQNGGHRGHQDSLQDLSRCTICWRRRRNIITRRRLAIRRRYIPEKGACNGTHVSHPLDDPRKIWSI